MAVRWYTTSVSPEHSLWGLVSTFIKRKIGLMLVGVQSPSQFMTLAANAYEPMEIGNLGLQEICSPRDERTQVTYSHKP